jgi:hypothetical protein
MILLRITQVRLRDIRIFENKTIKLLRKYTILKTKNKEISQLTKKVDTSTKCTNELTTG